jgi:uncharacterized protein YdeI (BOF family)
MSFNKTHRLIVLGLGACGLLLLAIWLLRGTSSVRQVQARGQMDSTVYLQGTVGDRVPLIDAQVYELQDKTGSIWVLTNDTTIQSGETVRIQATVRYQSIVVEGQELGEIYVEEYKLLKRESTRDLLQVR